MNPQPKEMRGLSLGYSFRNRVEPTRRSDYKNQDASKDQIRKQRGKEKHLLAVGWFVLIVCVVEDCDYGHYCYLIHQLCLMHIQHIWLLLETCIDVTAVYYFISLCLGWVSHGSRTTQRCLKNKETATKQRINKIDNQMRQQATACFISLDNQRVR